MEIRRFGPPKAIDAEGDNLRIVVMLTAPPDPTWVHFFRNFPSEYSSIAMPQLVEVDGQTLAFSSLERDVTSWLRLIDIWIADANKHYAEHVAKLRDDARKRQEAERERQRTIFEANERLRKL